MLDNLIYRGKRIGKGGKSFNLYKIKTMVVSKSSYYDEVNNRNDLVYGKLKEDSRIIKNRRWLRRYFIDELPQLINLFKGDMCIFGLRPISIKEFNMVSESFRKKYIKFKPGAIGPDYLYNPKSIEESFKYGEDYLDNKISKGFKSDLKYFIKQLSHVIIGDFRGL